MPLTDQEAHDELYRMAHELDGVNPPSREEAAAGTMRDEPEPEQAPTAGPSAPLAGPMALKPPPAKPRAPIDTSKPIDFMPRPAPHDAELEGLQQRAKQGRDMASIGNAVTAFTERPDHLADYAMRLSGGGDSAKMAHNTMWEDSAAEGERAVSDLMAQRKSDSEMRTQQASAAHAAEMADPNSERAQTYRGILQRFSPETDLSKATSEQMEKMAPWLEQFYKEHQGELKSQAAAKAKAEAEKKHDLERGEALRLAKEHRTEDVADRRANTRATQDLAAASLGLRQGADARDAAKDAREAAEKAKGHQTSTSTLTDLADAETAINELGPLGQKFKDLEMSGPVAKVSGKLTDALGLQGTDAAEYKAAALRAMQGVGKIMEGGKLATSDEDKYRRMLPQAGDPPEIAEQKIKESQSFLRKLKDERIKVLRDAGYNVPDVGGPSPRAASVKTMKLPSGEIVEVE